MTTSYIGQPTSRVDAHAKVTGGAKYAAEYNMPNLAHGCVVSSAVARGTIRRIDAGDALRLPGVLHVFTHENTPHLARADSSYVDEVGPPGAAFRPLHDGEIRFSAQPIALVVADTFELARYAASLVRVEYAREAHATDPDTARAQAYLPEHWDTLPPVPKSRGNAAHAFAHAAAQVDAEYRIPVEHHNPMELFGTTVVREPDGKLTVHDKTQGVQNVQGYQPARMTHCRYQRPRNAC